MEVTASTAANLVGNNRYTLNLFYTKLRRNITHKLEQAAQGCFKADFELDKPSFGEEVVVPNFLMGTFIVQQEGTLAV